MGDVPPGTGRRQPLGSQGVSCAAERCRPLPRPNSQVCAGADAAPTGGTAVSPAALLWGEQIANCA
eukprot:356454-Chlamydomonas_euryale.AAC.11